MSGSIILHPKLGLNPRLTFCPNCGKDGDEIVLLGMGNHISECGSCNVKVYGGGKCPKCGHLTVKVRDLEEHEKVPGSVCKACQELKQAGDKIVSEGGIYWRCADCGSAGVLKKSKFTEYVRMQHGKNGQRYAGPCGVEFTRKDCPECGPKEKPIQ